MLVRFARVLVFPWGLWHLCAWIPRQLRDRGGRWRRAGAAVLQGTLYLGIGLPATLLVSGEVAIVGNEWLVGEQADYTLAKKFDDPATPVLLPGARTTKTDAIPEDPEARRRWLVERYAPVIVQKVAHVPAWDIPLALDFDGNLDPRDNVQSEAAGRPWTASVYGELTAETEDSYYLTYSLYHVKDYDHPVRELVSTWTYHDNDNEGLHLRVDRESLEVMSVETWFHNRFLLFNRSGKSSGSEPVHGRVHLEDETHVLIYAQSQGHGVRCFQAGDLPSLRHSAKVLRHRAGGKAVTARVDRSVQVDVTYELVSFDSWYAAALGPFGRNGGGEGMFEETILLGTDAAGEEVRIGRFLAGRDYAKGSWARPKPPWSWDDAWDDLPVFVWHFMPSYSFEMHEGTRLSHRYLYNHPTRMTFGTDSPVSNFVPEIARRESDKWGELEGRGGSPHRDEYWKAWGKLAKAWVNRLFHRIG